MRDGIPSRLWLFAAAILTATPVTAAESPPVPVPGEATQELFLQVFLNGIDQEVIFRVERRGDTFYVAADDLSAVGLKIDNLPLDAHRDVALNAIAGVKYNYDEQQQRLDLTVPDPLRHPQLLGFGAPAATAAHSDLGVVLDYAMHVQSKQVSLAQRLDAGQRRYAPLIETDYSGLPLLAQDDISRAYQQRNQTGALDADMRVFSPIGLFVNSGYATFESGNSDYIRNDSYWTYSSVDSLRTWTVGDFISSSLPWTRAMRMGGARVARNFDVRPDLVTFPLPLLGGSAVVPTTVDLYVNGVRQFSGQAQPGPFVITDPPALTGSGLVSIVYQDALGRQVATAQPLYVDTRLLEAGLSDYAFEAGYARRRYGSESFDYSDTLAGVTSLRYGVNAGFTLEGHGEFAEGLSNVGVGGLFALSRFGVLNAAIAYSDGDGYGTLTSVGYQYVGRHWSIDLYDRRTQNTYQDLGSLERAPVPQRLTRGTFSVWFANSQALTATYAEQQVPPIGSARIVSLGYNANWYRSRVSTYVNLFTNLDQEDSDGAYVGVSVGFGGRTTIYSSASRFGDDRTAAIGANHPADYDLGGFGWNAYAEAGNDDYARGAARLDYRSRYGDWSVLVEHAALRDDKYTDASLYGEGALVLMKGELMATRSIYDGFALVSTGGMPYVPVLRENRLLGQTNRHGFLLVPDLPSYRTSRISIDPLGLPIDVSVPTDRLLANPRERSGVLVEFPLNRFEGATFILVDAQQKPLPPGTGVVLDSGERFLVGYDGQVFFPQLQPRNHL
ncbi:MAG TPA: fimbria/pilus outer membrane usher protein, partial [Povalibacter sp.]|nr:fimbria/pilus outer membrane usher protein [Povalibacter sp.]